VPRDRRGTGRRELSLAPRGDLLLGRHPAVGVRLGRQIPLGRTEVLPRAPPAAVGLSRLDAHLHPGGVEVLEPDVGSIKCGIELREGDDRVLAEQLGADGPQILEPITEDQEIPRIDRRGLLEIRVAISASLDGLTDEALELVDEGGGRVAHRLPHLAGDRVLARAGTLEPTDRGENLVHALLLMEEGLEIGQSQGQGHGVAHDSSWNMGRWTTMSASQCSSPRQNRGCLLIQTAHLDNRQAGLSLLCVFSQKNIHNTCTYFYEKSKLKWRE